MKTNSLSQDFLKLAVNKSILKEYQTSKSNRTVYLKNGTEFQLQLFNPLTFTICAEIYINDEKKIDGELAYENTKDCKDGNIYIFPIYTIEKNDFDNNKIFYKFCNNSLIISGVDFI